MKDWYLPVMEFLLYQVLLPLLGLTLLFSAFARFLPVSPADAALYGKTAYLLAGLAGLTLLAVFGLMRFAPPNKRIIPW